MAYRINNFFDDFYHVRKYYDEHEYEEVINPVDGKPYPGIGRVPKHLETEVRRKVGEPNYLFTRLSLEGGVTPHRAHNDQTMGEYTMIIYLNRPEDCQGGTSIVQHKETGVYRGPLTEEFVQTWERDTNNSNKWRVIKHFEMQTNSAVIYPSTLFHWSEPEGGFGQDQTDGRLVMVGFFDEVKIRGAG